MPRLSDRRVAQRPGETRTRARAERRRPRRDPAVELLYLWRSSENYTEKSKEIHRQAAQFFWYLLAVFRRHVCVLIHKIWTVYVWADFAGAKSDLWHTGFFQLWPGGLWWQEKRFDSCKKETSSSPLTRNPTKISEFQNLECITDRSRQAVSDSLYCSVFFRLIGLNHALIDWFWSIICCTIIPPQFSTRADGFIASKNERFKIAPSLTILLYCVSIPMKKRKRGTVYMGGPWRVLGDLYTESGQTLQGSFSAVSKPKFASK